MPQKTAAIPFLGIRMGLAEKKNYLEAGKLAAATA